MNTAGSGAVIPAQNNDGPAPVEINVDGSARSSVFTLEARSSEPGYTRAYLNALMDVYLEYKRNIRKDLSGGTLASITKEVQETERELKDRQDILMAFQQTNNAAVLEQEGAVAGTYLATLQTKLTDLQLEDRLLRATELDHDAAKSGTNPPGVWFGPVANVSSSMTPADEVAPRQAALRELELLKIQRDQLSQQLRPKHPKIAKLDADIARTGTLIQLFSRQSREQLEESRKATTLKMDNIAASIKDWETKVLEANSRIVESERLKLDVQRVQNQYDRLVVLLQNVGLGRTIDQENIAILERATPAQRSFQTGLRLMVAAVCGGIGLGFGIIVLLAFRDDRFMSLAEVNEAVGELVVGQVPAVGHLLPDATLPLLENKDVGPWHAYNESFRGLRSALLFMTNDSERPRVILVTSALSNEGKSTVAANLARSLALGGARVVLVDGDLRRGALHELMKLQPEPGLAEILQHPEDLEQMTQVNSHPNLRFIARGRVADNAGDLLLGSSFDELMKVLRQKFDFVIVDSSPMFATDDASAIAPKVDGTLFVVRNRFSSPASVREALGLLYQRRARVLGIVFNQADINDRSYYYCKEPAYYPSPKPA